MTVHTVDAYPVAIGKNPERSREHNRRVVLDIVRRHGSLGRAQGRRAGGLLALLLRLDLQSCPPEGEGHAVGDAEALLAQPSRGAAHS